jgi:hypothetical protein
MLLPRNLIALTGGLMLGATGGSLFASRSGATYATCELFSVFAAVPVYFMARSYRWLFAIVPGLALGIILWLERPNLRNGAVLGLGGWVIGFLAGWGLAVGLGLRALAWLVEPLFAEQPVMVEQIRPVARKRTPWRIYFQCAVGGLLLSLIATLTYGLCRLFAKSSSNSVEVMLIVLFLTSIVGAIVLPPIGIRLHRRFANQMIGWCGLILVLLIMSTTLHGILYVMLTFQSPWHYGGK